MQLAIFGGTGRTGVHLVGQALDAGHSVTILSRSPEKLNLQHAQLHVIKGDVTDPTAVEEVVRGVDAVLSVLGPTENKPDFKVTRGTQNILNAMKDLGVQRLIVSAGAGVGDQNDVPTFTNRFVNILLKLVSRYVYEDMMQVVDLVRKSEVDWTIVRVPILTDDPATKRVKAGYVGKGMGMHITRADMADFILKQASDTTYLRQAPAISNDRSY
jgi:putative NADH-flavin reductase